MVESMTTELKREYTDDIKYAVVAFANTDGGKIYVGINDDGNFYITEYDTTYNEKGLAQSKLWKPGTLCITIAANIADTGILAIDACFPDSIMGFTP